MASLGKINLAEEAPNHPFVRGAIIFGMPKPQSLGALNDSIVLDRQARNDSPNKHVSAEPVEKPKYSPSLQLKTPEWRRDDPPWWLIELTVHSCRGEMDDGYGEYCILAKQDSNTYVQTAVCLAEKPDDNISWRLEWRVTDPDGTYTHYFAGNPSDGADAETVKDIDIVVKAFKAFYQNKGLPDSLIWKKYDI